MSAITFAFGRQLVCLQLFEIQEATPTARPTPGHCSADTITVRWPFAQRRDWVRLRQTRSWSPTAAELADAFITCSRVQPHTGCCHFTLHKQILASVYKICLPELCRYVLTEADFLLLQSIASLT